MTRNGWTLLILLALGASLGCSGKPHEDPLLALSAQEALDLGKSLLAQEKYFKARRYLTHAFEVEPNSRNGREALLLSADTLFLQGSTDNFVKCEAKYRDFLNRFPTSDRAGYAQYQVGRCLASRIGKPDRDQKVTHQAIAAFEEMLRLYPTSEYAGEASARIAELTQQLAMHEMSVGNFYMRYGRKRIGICTAAISRFETIKQDFPNFDHMDEVLLRLGLAYDRCRRYNDADAVFGELEAQYPSSQYLAELHEYLGKRKRSDTAEAEETPGAG